MLLPVLLSNAGYDFCRMVTSQPETELTLLNAGLVLWLNICVNTTIWIVFFVIYFAM